MSATPAARSHRRVSVWRFPSLTAALLALLILGPALGPGIVLAYDMAWSPDPRWTPFVLGVDTPAPRAVPSDAVAVLLGWTLSAPIAQKAILFGILVLAGSGAAALLRAARPHTPQWAAHVATVAALWNPFVYERLAMGHWTVLLGYAVLPWLIRSVLTGRDATILTAAGWVGLAGLGGANALVIAGFGILAGALGGLKARGVAALVGVWLGCAAAWAVPALSAQWQTRDPDGGSISGAAAFAPRADMPLGVAASLLSGGGLWNPASHPSTRDVLVIAVLSTLLAVVVGVVGAASLWRAGVFRPVAVMGVLALALCLFTAASAVGPVWSAIVHGLPGGGLLRDSQKFIGPWVLLMALGSAVTADRLRSRARHQDVGVVLAVIIALAPMALLPTLGWGLAGRLDPVAVPEGYRATTEEASALPRGVVGVLPWGQFRRYEWNESRVSLTLAPRIIDQPVLFDDGLPLTGATVAGEDARAARVSAAIGAGVDPVTALSDEGVIYIAVEQAVGSDVEIPAGATIVAQSDDLVVIEVGDPASTPTQPAASTGWLTVGWIVTLITSAGVFVGAAVSQRHRIRGLV